MIALLALAFGRRRIAGQPFRSFARRRLRHVLVPAAVDRAGADSVRVRRMAKLREHRGGDQRPGAEPGAGHVLGVIVVVVLYLSLNLAYLWVMTPAADRGVAGARGRHGARGRRRRRRALRRAADRRVESGFSGGRDPDRTAADLRDGGRRPVLRAAARLHPRYQTPVFALWFQAAVSLVLLTTNTYDQLLSYVVFADWLFFGLTAGALLIVRRRDPEGARRPASRRCRVIRGRRSSSWSWRSVWSLNSFAAYPTQSLIGSAILLVAAVVFFVVGRPKGLRYGNQT